MKDQKGKRPRIVAMSMDDLTDAIADWVEGRNADLADLNPEADRFVRDAAGRAAVEQPAPEARQAVDDAWSDNPSGRGGSVTRWGPSHGGFMVRTRYWGVRKARRLRQVRDVAQGVVVGGMLGAIYGGVLRLRGGAFTGRIEPGHIELNVVACLHGDEYEDDDGDDGGGPELDLPDEETERAAGERHVDYEDDEVPLPGSPHGLDWLSPGES